MLSVEAIGLLGSRGFKGLSFFFFLGGGGRGGGSQCLGVFGI